MKFKIPKFTNDLLVKISLAVVAIAAVFGVEIENPFAEQVVEEPVAIVYPLLSESADRIVKEECTYILKVVSPDSYVSGSFPVRFPAGRDDGEGLAFIPYDIDETVEVYGDYYNGLDQLRQEARNVAAAQVSARLKYHFFGEWGPVITVRYVDKKNCTRTKQPPGRDDLLDEEPLDRQ